MRWLDDVSTDLRKMGINGETEQRIERLGGVGGQGPPRTVATPKKKKNIILWGHAVALRYKPKCRGFDTRWCHWNFSLT
jgi:hypothetical protein